MTGFFRAWRRWCIMVVPEQPTQHCAQGNPLWLADQPFWGRRVAELGVGAPPIAPRRLTAERLAAALQVLTQDGNIRRRAGEVGALLRAEDGLSGTCKLVEQFIQ